MTHSNGKDMLQRETQLRGWRRRAPCDHYLALGLLPAEPGFPNCTLKVPSKRFTFKQTYTLLTQTPLAYRDPLSKLLLVTHILITEDSY